MPPIFFPFVFRPVWGSPPGDLCVGTRAHPGMDRVVWPTRALLLLDPQGACEEQAITQHLGRQGRCPPGGGGCRQTAFTPPRAKGSADLPRRWELLSHGVRWGNRGKPLPPQRRTVDSEPTSGRSLSRHIQLPLRVRAGGQGGSGARGAGPSAAGDR